MFITPAFAQTTGFGGGDMLTSLLPFALIFVIMYFLILRPQQKRARQQRDMLSSISRGDTVVTTGGIVGKVTKAVEGEDLEVEIAPGARVKVVRGMIADVRNRANPVNDNKPA